MKSSSTAQLVVDWLEGLARAGLEQFPAKAAYFADNICWENTLHDITHGIDSDLLVSEMVKSPPCLSLGVCVCVYVCVCVCVCVCVGS